MIGLTEEAQSGWLDYAELWESAQPNQTMSYGERVGGSCEEKDRDPTWLIKAGELRVFNKRLDPRVSRKADEIMRMRESIAFNAMALSIMEKVGIRLAKAFKDWE
jgi:alkyl sulfatase BDS1-like metallo-beta-lactamase superfamily hydrolase